MWRRFLAPAVAYASLCRSSCPLQRLNPNSISIGAIFAARRSFHASPRFFVVASSGRVLPLPQDQSDFSAYTEIDLPTQSRIDATHRSGLGKGDWIGLEKVHGTNFGVYLIDETTVRFSKRSGIMDPKEHFFGYHLLIDEFTAQIRGITEILKHKLSLGRIGRVVLNGELFGARYEHPLVPKSTQWCTLPDGKKFPIASVTIQDEEFPQYSPELHYYAFDLKYSVTGLEEDFKIVTYDDFVEVCSQVQGLLYARAVIRGTLDHCLAFDVENFKTPLPALLGLGNYPLEDNYAEGLVIRHARRGSPEIESLGVATMIKVRCSSFMELKHPNKQRELKETFLDTVRAAAVKKVGDTVAFAESMLPQMESAANALLINYVSEGRLKNTFSKIGREPLLDGSISADDLSLMLAKDALKDFLKEVDESMLNMPLQFRKLLITNCYNESKKLVGSIWEKLLDPQGSNSKEGQEESA